MPATPLASIGGPGGGPGGGLRAACGEAPAGICFGTCDPPGGAGDAPLTNAPFAKEGPAPPLSPADFSLSPPPRVARSSAAERALMTAVPAAALATEATAPTSHFAPSALALPASDVPEAFASSFALLPSMAALPLPLSSGPPASPFSSQPAAEADAPAAEAAFAVA